MASNNDYDSDLAGDTLTATKAKQRQTSFDQTNLPAQYQSQPQAGPISRVAQQLPATSSSSGQSLADGFNMGAAGGSRPIYASVGANGEASFSGAPSSLESLSPSANAPDQSAGHRQPSQVSGLPQAANSSTQPTGPSPTSLADLAPGGRTAPAVTLPGQSLASANLSAIPGPTYTSLDQIMPGSLPTSIQPPSILPGSSLSDLALAGRAPTAQAQLAAPASLADAAPKQTSFDATNTAARYLPQQPQSPESVSSARITAAPAAPPQAPSLTDVAPRPVAGLQSAGQGPVQPQTASAPPSGTLASALSNPGQFAHPPQAQQPQPLSSVAPVGVKPTATSPTYPTPSQQTASPVDVAPKSSDAAPAPAQQPQGLDPSYRPTGIGSGDNAIAARIGADGVPEFTNAPADLASAGGQAPIKQAPAPAASLSDAQRIAAPSSGPGFAALGSSANMGDGIGTFSQANQGDAALAMSRFQKAADLRDGYKAQDRLQEAVAAQTRDRNFNVVRDSTTPVTRREQAFDLSRALNTQGFSDAVTGAQSAVDAQRQGVAANQQQRQANRLEDALTAATAPNAQPAQKQAYQTLVDPTNEKGLARQLTQAKIDETNASAAKLRNAPNKTGNLPVGLQKLEDGDIDAVSNVQSINTQMGNILGQLDNGSLVLGPLENRKNAALNAAGSSNPQSVNYASFMSSLEKIRNDSLRLNKGPQTEGDANRAWNELLANVNDPKVVKQRLGEIQAMNNKAAQVRLGMINSRRKNQNIGPLNIDDILGGSPPASQPTPQPQSGGSPSTPAQQAPSAQTPAVPQIQNDDDFNKLPSGAQFIDPQGMHRRKP